MTSTPLTDQQLNDIDTRQKAATPGPWTVSEDYSDVLGPDGGQLASYWNPTSETRNGEFIAHAPEDVRALLAEVSRLKEQRKFLLTVLAKRDAESGRADEAVRQFLAVPDPICGDENDGDWCELEPGHEGHHGADTVEWAAAATPSP